MDSAQAGNIQLAGCPPHLAGLWIDDAAKQPAGFQGQPLAALGIRLIPAKRTPARSLVSARRMRFHPVQVGPGIIPRKQMILHSAVVKLTDHVCAAQAVEIGTAPVARGRNRDEQAQSRHNEKRQSNRTAKAFCLGRRRLHAVLRRNHHSPNSPAGLMAKLRLVQGELSGSVPA